VTTPHRRLRGEPGGRAPAPRALRLAQEFINTYNIERSHLGLRTDEFESPADLRRWLTDRGLLRGAAVVRAADVRRAVEVREALRRLALAHNPAHAGLAVGMRRRRRMPATAEAARVLARLARDARLVIQVRRDGTMGLEPDAPGVVGALGRLVAAALAAQLNGTWHRLKACRRCHWAFYDHSRNRSGAWCSMSICGNRVKATTYRAQHRAPSPALMSR
jgi:predicted RNA-binding Zn ribbon-like protein